MKALNTVGYLLCYLFFSGIGMKLGVDANFHLIIYLSKIFSLPFLYHVLVPTPFTKGDPLLSQNMLLP